MDSMRRFLMRFLELQIPMGLALVCYLLGRMIPPWMIFRDYSRQFSLEMAVAMIAPVAVIALVGELAGSTYLLWLVTSIYPAMCLGILVYMLYRRDELTRRAGNSVRAARYQES